MVKKMVQIINSYDTFLEYIDSYRQEMQARERNNWLNGKFNELMQDVSKGYDRGVPVYLQPATEDKVTEWLRRYEVPAWLRMHYEATER